MTARVRPVHGRELGFCMAGQKRWCKVAGIDYRRFVKEGLSVEEAMKYASDERIAQMIRLAQEDAANE